MVAAWRGCFRGISVSADKSASRRQKAPCRQRRYGGRGGMKSELSRGTILGLALAGRVAVHEPDFRRFRARRGCSPRVAKFQIISWPPRARCPRFADALKGGSCSVTMSWWWAAVPRPFPTAGKERLSRQSCRWHYWKKHPSKVAINLSVELQTDENRRGGCRRHARQAGGGAKNLLWLSGRPVRSMLCGPSIPMISAAAVDDGVAALQTAGIGRGLNESAI